jgi:hypothetical protein
MWLKFYSTAQGRYHGAVSWDWVEMVHPVSYRLDRRSPVMPLFEVETDSHIIITWANSEDAAKDVVLDSYPSDEVLRLTRRPRDTWVISKGALGLTNTTLDPCTVARDCLSRSAGDKVNAIRLYRMETGSDLEHARKAIESNMVMGW